VVIGYTLPPTDQFFRYLDALVTVSATRLGKFLVYLKRRSQSLQRKAEGPAHQLTDPLTILSRTIPVIRENPRFGQADGPAERRSA
jgi:hypothetical protein